MIWDSACPPSCRAPHEGGYAKIPKLDEITVGIERAGEAEMEELWSFIGKKKEQRWRWHAIDHLTGTVLAYVFGRRQDEVFLKLQGL